MAQSWGKFMLKISLVLISSTATHADRANVHSTDDINNSSNITVKYAEKIRNKIQQRMMSTTDDLSAVRQQLNPHHALVNISWEREQLQGKLSEMTRALQNCDFQVKRTQRRDNPKLHCGQLFIMLPIGLFWTRNYKLCTGNAFITDHLLFNLQLELWLKPKYESCSWLSVIYVLWYGMPEVWDQNGIS